MSDVVAELDEGLTLPYSWYTDETIFRGEVDRVISSTWQYVCGAAQLPQVGDFLTFQLAGTPIVVVRESADRVNAFLNVCRHRGAEVVMEERGCRKTLQCHYHAWTYNLDGTLRSAPSMAAEPGFDPAEHGLIPVRTAWLGPFLFINLDGNAAELDSLVGEMADQMNATAIDWDNLVFHERRVYDTNANWKIVVENYLECYHCPVAHKSFTDIIDLNNYESAIHEHFQTYNGPVKAEALEQNVYGVAGLPKERQRIYNFQFWPNFMMNVYPGPSNVSTNWIVPVAPDRTLAVYDFFYGPEVAAEDAREITEFIDLVQQEDIPLCESVQRGAGSGRVSRGRLALGEESLIANFQRQTARALLAR